MNPGVAIIIGVQAVSLIPIWLAWGWLVAAVASVAVIISHRGIWERTGETVGISLPRLVFRIGVAFGIPIAGFCAARTVWDPYSAGFLLGFFLIGLIVFTISLITR